MPELPTSTYVATNHKMWETAAALYGTEAFKRDEARVRSAEFNTFDDIERQVFTSAINLKGKRVVQLGCSNGLELINLKRRGAGPCLGVDNSETFIGQARLLARAAGEEITFVCSDVYGLDDGYSERFDLVYLTVGVLGWLPDLPGFFCLGEQLLAKGGQVFVYEQHPILNVFNPEPPHPTDASYFQKQPFQDETLPEYIDKAATGRATSFWFPHTLADILSACIASELRITGFAEHAKEISATYPALADQAAQFPLSFTLIANKN